MTKLLKLYNWLHKNNFKKLAQEIKDLDTDTEEYAEPWHQEVVEELNKKDEESLKNLEDKYTYSQDELNLTNIKVDTIQQILEKENFKALYSNRSVVAGRGAYGVVLRGVYQGKPAVIKIETNIGRPVTNEINNWMLILKLKETMPPEYKKHIPDIYKLNSDSVFKSGKETFYSVIIMEELFKLNDEIGELMSVGTPNSFMTIVELILNNLDYVYQVSVDISNSLEQFESTYFRELQLPSSHSVFKIIYNNLINLKSQNINKVTFYDKNTDEIVNQIKIKTGKIYSLFIAPVDLKNNIHSHLSKMFRRFPDSKQKSFVWENMPETQNFFKTLEYLNQNANLSWNDLHIGNVMMDRDGNLKIIDVGLYEENME
jgi:hypothetical protein